MTFVCCVTGCCENGKRRLHSFPKDQLQCKKWIRATWCFSLNKETAWKTHYKVCRKHFRECDFKNWNLLNKGVVPSLMLPHAISMQHDYCTRNSVVVNTNPSERTNSLQETNNDNPIEDSTMEVIVDAPQVLIQHRIIMEHDYCAKNSIVVNANAGDVMNSFQETNIDNPIKDHTVGVSVDAFRVVEHLNISLVSLQGGVNEVGCIQNLPEEDFRDKIASGNSTDDRTFRIPDEVPTASTNNDSTGHNNAYDHVKMKSVPRTENESKVNVAYDPVARKMRYLLKRNKDLAKKLKESQTANLKSHKTSKVKKKIDMVLKTLALELPPAHYNFIKLQIKNTGKAKKGNRFTFEEKTLALVIYKQNPKRYRDLLKMANLPTRRTLIAHSATVRFKEGINQHLMDFIKKEVSEMSELDKVCTIGWDEMSLTANLNFDQIKDYIDGFEDIGSKQTNEFATHALVFMVRGIKTAFKQPVAYFLTQNLNASELAELIKLVIEAVMDTGLKVIGSVCDAVATNRAAVNRLIYPNRRRANTTGELLEYSINGSKIWHYFDPPHLIKSVRNNLLTKNLNHNVSFNEAKFRPNGAIVWNDKNKVQRTASWKDVDDFYIFNDTGFFNLLPKITPEHINPVKRKMKVNLATQVLSGTFGRNMYLCSKRKQFLNNCLGTSAILLFFNELFDSVNGSDVPIPGKLIGAVTLESEHFKFWDYAIRMLDNMSYTENLATGHPNKSKVCKHFVSTLKAFRKISEQLFEIGLKSIGLRRLDQDGLENNFFKIRAYCGSNPKPNCRDFRNAYTTSIFNNQITSHSLNANCEADEDKYLLRNLHVLFGSDSKHSTGCASTNIEKNTEFAEQNTNPACDNRKLLKATHPVKLETFGTTFAEDEAQNCVSGNICKQLMKKFKCDFCLATVAVPTNKKSVKCVEHDVMRKQSSVGDIVLPNVEFIKCIKIIISNVQTMLPLLCSEKNLMTKLLAGMPEYNNDKLIGCDVHRSEFINEMWKCTTKLVIGKFTQRVNRILSGNVKVATNCIIQKKALAFKAKNKNIGKYAPPQT